jgi:hypothetical protein
MVASKSLTPDGMLEHVEPVQLQLSELIHRVHLVFGQGGLDDPVDGPAVGVPELVGDGLVGVPGVARPTG